MKVSFKRSMFCSNTRHNAEIGIDVLLMLVPFAMLTDHWLEVASSFTESIGFDLSFSFSLWKFIAQADCKEGNLISTFFLGLCCRNLKYPEEGACDTPIIMLQWKSLISHPYFWSEAGCVWSIFKNPTWVKALLNNHG